MLSGKMKDTQIDLTKHESDLLRLKVDGLLDKVRSFEDERIPLIKELEVQRLKVKEQAALIANLEAQLEQRDRGPDRLHQKQEEILKLLHHNESLSVEQMAGSIGISAPDTRGHLDALSADEYVALDLNKTMGLRSVVSRSGLVASRGGRQAPSQKSLGHYYIKAKGRAYVMKNG